jgi:mRNA interferase YafQ
MRTIERKKRFKQDYKKLKSGIHAKTVDTMLLEIVGLLVNDSQLPERYFDHPLTGEWKDYRDLHIKPDLAPIYRKPNDATLELIRIGSHSELGI